MSQQLLGSLAELQCLNYVFQKNSMQIIQLNSITEDYFTTYKKHYKFLKDFYEKYNQIPSKEVFQVEFKDSFDWLNVTDSEEFIIDKLREAKLYRDLIVDYNQITELLKDEKSDIAIERMGALAQKYLKEKPAPVSDLVADVKQRYDIYLDKVHNPTTSFITTGVKELDDIFGGWDMKNESAVIAARTGIGKSWWLTYFALQGVKQGLNVGYYSGEMEPELVGYRMDTFFGGIPNGALTHGNESILEQYTQYIEDLSKVLKGHLYCLTPEMIGGNATVSRLRAFIEKYNLDMLCVDQLSLMDDERKGRSTKEQLDNISKDLRTLQRLKKIPILSASQLNREEYEDGPSTRNISGSDRVGHDATIVLFVERKQGDQMVFTIGKARNAQAGDKLTYYWNVNLGVLNYIPTQNDAKKDSVEEIKKVEESYNDVGRSNSVF